MAIKNKGLWSAPQLPATDVAAVVAVTAEELETFKEKVQPLHLRIISPVRCTPPRPHRRSPQHISSAKIKDYDSDDAQARIGTTKVVRALQFKRWKWAVENISVYVNMLRAAGHSDEAIIGMFKGRPLCFAKQENYDEFQAALAKLGAEVEAQCGWQQVEFIVTGSSVAGFSQNPLKGFADRPSKITSTSKSDVDICLLADGVKDWVARCKSEGKAYPERMYPTTESQHTSSMRFGVKDLANVCEALGAFHKQWSEKLAGGLQITFAEDNLDIPPWEARIPLTQVANSK